ncbi:MAG: hypothetical protein HYR98_08560 [Nitrospirae bacterium]|nr:hypothetical protein [Nitrospirota bacterium]
MAPLRVLTFNWHEAYVCLLARTGHAFTVVDKHNGGHAGWLRGTRPVPANVDLLPIGSEGMVREEALRGAFDIAVCHKRSGRTPWGSRGG